MQSKLANLVQFPNRMKRKDSYWSYLTPEFDLYLQDYLSVFEKYRKEIQIIPPSEQDWKLLPFGSFASDSSWKWRRESLSIITKIIKKKKFECVLEVGSWNGWLTKTLAQHSEIVIATDYFVCPFDGIANISSLAENIIPIQCNVDELKTDFKPKVFDLIVLNHNLSYMNNPAEYIQHLIPLLQPNGTIISLGNTFYKNPENKIVLNATFAKNFNDNYHRNVYIQPVKGYLDQNDKIILLDSNFKIGVASLIDFFSSNESVVVKTLSPIANCRP